MISADAAMPQRLGATRSAALIVSAPFHWLAHLPHRWIESGLDYGRTRNALIRENRRLKKERLMHMGRAQIFDALREENVNLHRLLNSEAMREYPHAMLANVIGLPNPDGRHAVWLDRGASHGVAIGMVALDHNGVVGQIIEVSPANSRLLLISDSSHSIPVRLPRLQLDALLEGIGDYKRLKLRHITHTTDIRRGDILQSSGLGGRFAAGYPVARVSEVTQDATRAFSQIHAEPAAKLRGIRHLLLLSAARQR